MPNRRTAWIGGALAAGTVVVLVPPVLLFWSAIQPQPLDSSTVKVRFQSVRYEAGGLAFRYSVQNLTHRSARFVPDSTQIRALQPADRPLVGYANVRLPLELPAESVTVVELRLELPGSLSLSGEASDGLTRAILQHQPPGTPSDTDAPVSPLPMRGKMASAENPPPQSTPSVEDSLSNLEGFELSDSALGIRLVFPRGW